jgi:hypothetical protein
MNIYAWTEARYRSLRITRMYRGQDSESLRPIAVFDDPIVLIST